MSPENHHANLLFRLSLTARRWRQVLDSEFQSWGLTEAMWRPLLHLHVLGDGVRQKNLAASVGIEGPSMVRLIEALVVRGLIRRAEDAGDRRAKLLFLTEEGRGIVSRMRETVALLDKEVLDSFTGRELAQLERFITRIETAVSDMRRSRR
jgi:MarR family transcriptional regulator, transcriptional regulator for hemolysin